MFFYPKQLADRAPDVRIHPRAAFIPYGSLLVLVVVIDVDDAQVQSVFSGEVSRFADWLQRAKPVRVGGRRKSLQVDQRLAQLSALTCAGPNPPK